MDPRDEIIKFPPITSATADGLLMIGGPLVPSTVLSAYRQGIFPWPMVDEGLELLAWFSPDPRAVFELDEFHVSRRLARRIRSGYFQVTCDRDFPGVMAGCAAPRGAGGQTWITRDMIRVYGKLQELGNAHSVEVWHHGDLVGGVYGISLGAFFAGESMFFRQRDASKVALTYLVAHLRARGFQLFDVQQATAHCVRLGAREIPRRDFLRRLRVAVTAPINFGSELDTSHLPALLQH